MNNITVSVIMMTYGHEPYIIDAIEGVRIQNCNFNVELLIADDNSPDGTKNKVEDYLNSVDIPKNIEIKYFQHEKNNGANSNYLWASKKAKGKYIANCEGDDYWTDPLKLQKQVDFLEENKEFNGVFTNVDLLTNSTFTKNALKSKHKKDHSLDSFFIDAWIPTLTILFRTNLIITLPESPKAVISGDLLLFAHLLNTGKLKYFDEISGVYRQHSEGVWSGANQLKILNNRIHLNKYFIKMYASNDKELNKTLKNRIKTNHFKKAKYYKNKREYLNMISSLIKFKL
ncbi:glycosyltransferase [Psychroflexus gondwanensis]|jgi:glycosyltransferase involved in cell wall biosynthesis|uniref:glycosyltransferase family 2 protein n=1 Tax=Psychroflexus gondwanensis TaxID=251 RepID=UPI0011BF04B1|nr:glycosyltransferase [Psychroflexus gondwanensis]TXE21549.1 glycosyltransferase [Psychroflexus gondwanensis]